MTDNEWAELKLWCCENEERMLEVSRNIAMTSGGYSHADERFALGQLSADMLAKGFRDMEVAEQQGYDLLFNFRAQQVRISVKASQHIFEERRKKGNGFCKPRAVTMTNARSTRSANSRRSDFDILLVIQTGPLQVGKREGLHVVRFGIVPNSEWLQNKYITNNDKQQTVRISDEEWRERGFFSTDCEVIPVSTDETRRIEKEVRRIRREKLEHLIGLHILRLPPEVSEALGLWNLPSDQQA